MRVDDWEKFLCDTLIPRYYSVSIIRQFMSSAGKPCQWLPSHIDYRTRPTTCAQRIPEERVLSCERIHVLVTGDFQLGSRIWNSLPAALQKAWFTPIEPIDPSHTCLLYTSIRFVCFRRFINFLYVCMYMYVCRELRGNGDGGNTA